MATRLVVLLAICLSLLASVAIGQQHQQSQQSQAQQRRAQQCRLQRLTASQPSHRLQSEGGVTELWDENDDQFQCAGVAAMKSILRPNSLSLPNFHPAPRLVYIERGQGLLGVNFPGCPETFQWQQSSPRRSREERREEGQQEDARSRRDQHQKIRRVRQGDIIALPPGVAHWCFNDGDEELVAVSINDLNHQANQLDQKFRAYYLAGGPPRGGQQSRQGEETFQNILSGFDEELMAEAFNVPTQIVSKLQRDDDRGLIVSAREELRMIRPDEKEEEEEEREYRWGPRSNGLDESWCTMRLRHNIDDRREAAVYSRGAGYINSVNQHTLPILRYMDLSAEKGHLFPDALYTPHWSVNGHSIVYVIRGEGQVQVVDHSGQDVMNDNVSQGDMFVIPQYFAATLKAGRNGVEWLSFKTTGSPRKSPVAGYTSVMRAMPLEVITNSYQVSPGAARNLKYNRGRETFMATPWRRSS